MQAPMPANNVADRKALTLYKSPRPQDTLGNPSLLKNGAGSIATCAARVARHAPPSHTVVPVFAIAVRRAYDYGPAAGRAMQDKRAASFACGTLVVRDMDLPSKDVVQSNKASAPESPIIFRRGEIADAAPAVPGWRMRVEELCGEQEDTLMAARGKTVRILFQDGQERTFTQVVVDQETAGWLFLTRIQESPIISGVAAPVAAYRLQTLQRWEYVDAETAR